MKSSNLLKPNKITFPHQSKTNQENKPKSSSRYSSSLLEKSSISDVLIDKAPSKKTIIGKENQQRNIESKETKRESIGKLKKTSELYINEKINRFNKVYRNQSMHMITGENFDEIETFTRLNNSSINQKENIHKKKKVSKPILDNLPSNQQNNSLILNRSSFSDKMIQVKEKKCDNNIVHFESCKNLEPAKTMEQSKSYKVLEKRTSTVNKPGIYLVKNNNLPSEHSQSHRNSVTDITNKNENKSKNSMLSKEPKIQETSRKIKRTKLGWLILVNNLYTLLNQKPKKLPNEKKSPTLFDLVHYLKNYEKKYHCQEELLNKEEIEHEFSEKVSLAELLKYFKIILNRDEIYLPYLVWKQGSKEIDLEKTEISFNSFGRIIFSHESIIQELEKEEKKNKLPKLNEKNEKTSTKNIENKETEHHTKPHPGSVVKEEDDIVETARFQNHHENNNPSPYYSNKQQEIEFDKKIKKKNIIFTKDDEELIYQEGVGNLISKKLAKDIKEVENKKEKVHAVINVSNNYSNNSNNGSNNNSNNGSNNHNNNNYNNVNTNDKHFSKVIEKTCNNNNNNNNNINISKVDKTITNKKDPFVLTNHHEEKTSRMKKISKTPNHECKSSNMSNNKYHEKYSPIDDMSEIMQANNESINIMMISSFNNNNTKQQKNKNKNKESVIIGVDSFNYEEQQYEMLNDDKWDRKCDDKESKELILFKNNNRMSELLSSSEQEESEEEEEEEGYNNTNNTNNNTINNNTTYYTITSSDQQLALESCRLQALNMNSSQLFLESVILSNLLYHTNFNTNISFSDEPLLEEEEQHIESSSLCEEQEELSLFNNNTYNNKKNMSQEQQLLINNYTKLEDVVQEIENIVKSMKSIFAFDEDSICNNYISNNNDNKLLFKCMNKESIKIQDLTEMEDFLTQFVDYKVFRQDNKIANTTTTQIDNHNHNQQYFNAVKLTESNLTSLQTKKASTKVIKSNLIKNYFSFFEAIRINQGPFLIQHIDILIGNSINKIKILNLADNELYKLEGLVNVLKSNMGSLEFLNLSNNRIASLRALFQVLNGENVDVDENDREIESERKCFKQLRELHLKNNKICELGYEQCYQQQQCELKQKNIKNTNKTTNNNSNRHDFPKLELLDLRSNIIGIEQKHSIHQLIQESPQLSTMSLKMNPIMEESEDNNNNTKEISGLEKLLNERSIYEYESLQMMSAYIKYKDITFSDSNEGCCSVVEEEGVFSKEGSD